MCKRKKEGRKTKRKKENKHWNIERLKRKEQKCTAQKPKLTSAEEIVQSGPPWFSVNAAVTFNCHPLELITAGTSKTHSSPVVMEDGPMVKIPNCVRGIRGSFLPFVLGSVVRLLPTIKEVSDFGMVVVNVLSPSLFFVVVRKDRWSCLYSVRCFGFL